MSALSDRLREAAGGKTYDDVVELTHQAGMPLGKGTVHRLMTGAHGKVKQDTLIAIAKALRLDERELRVLADRPAGDLGPYIPTKNAASLTKEQRDAIDRMIDAFVGGDSSADRRSKAEKNVTDLASRRDGDWRAAYEAGQLAADTQDREPEGDRIRREQDEAAERQD